MHKVLVLDAHQRSALAVIRSLGRHGLTIVAADHRPHPLGAASRYANTSIRHPDPAASPRAFVQEILAVVDRLGIDLVIPATDLTTMLLVSQPHFPQIAKLATPHRESYEALTDKARLFKLAETLGITAPETHVARTAPEILDAAHDLGFPVVLKPARSRYLKGDHIFATQVEIVRDPEALTDIVPRQTWLGDIPCLVQRFIPGHGAGIFALFGAAGPVAWFAHRRIREKPPSGGVSVLSESVPIDSTLQSAATALLTAVNWTGVAMVEFRIAEDGTPYLMEVNGRFWGSLQLAIDCGVDFPWLLYQVAQGSSVKDLQPYIVGKRMHWVLGDLDSLLIQLRQARTSWRTKAQAIPTFMHSFFDPTCRQEIFRLFDPLPSIREFSNWLKAL